MAYDALAESVRLIENGVPGTVARRLSRRIRHIPLAVDVSGPIAATLFLRRGKGKGQVWLESHVLVQHHGSWRREGMGGATVKEAAAEDAPGYKALGRYVDVSGSGAVHLGYRDPALPRVVRYAPMRAAREVRTVMIADRAVPVPRHGQLIAVWPDRRTPRLTALDAANELLAAGDVETWSGTRSYVRRRLPEVYQDDSSS